MFVTVGNTTSGPVTVDADGRHVYAHDWGTADEDAPEAKAALKVGHLVLVDVPDDGQPDAVAARDRTDAVNAATPVAPALAEVAETPAPAEAEVAPVETAQDAAKAAPRARRTRGTE
jgi:hypothetical protein